MIAQRLDNKMSASGTALIVVPAAYSSLECRNCGHSVKENRKSQAEFQCVRCGHQDHADLQAATTILARATAPVHTSGPELAAHELTAGLEREDPMTRKRHRESRDLSRGRRSTAATLGDGLPIEWGEWSDTAGAFMCPPPKPQPCKHCGSVAEPLINLGHIWTEPAIASHAIGLRRLQRGRHLVANLSAFRCPDCERDWVLAGDEQRDLDATDYTDAGPYDTTSPLPALTDDGARPLIWWGAGLQRAKVCVAAGASEASKSSGQLRLGCMHRGGSRRSVIARRTPGCSAPTVASHPAQASARPATDLWQLNIVALSSL